MRYGVSIVSANLTKVLSFQMLCFLHYIIMYNRDKLRVYGNMRKLHCSFLFSANRLTGVTVKASGQTPPLEDVTALDGTGFTLCGMYTKVTKPAEIVSIACAPRVSGRYVYVHLSSKNFLQICEVEVYGDRKYITNIFPVQNWYHLQLGPLLPAEILEETMDK